MNRAFPLVTGIAVAWITWDAWRAWRIRRRRRQATHGPILAPPTSRLPQPTPAELDRLWALISDAQGGERR